MTRRDFGAFLAGLTLVVFGGWSGPARATLAISDAPLFISAPVEPNILFILDDSGSMHWEVMPDDLMVAAGCTLNNTTDNVCYMVMPRPSTASLYGPGTSPSRRMIEFRDDYIWNLRFRSNHPQNNSIFYNPGRPIGLGFVRTVPRFRMQTLRLHPIYRRTSP